MSEITFAMKKYLHGINKQVIRAERKRMMREYDEVFNKIMACEKKSDEHRRLIKIASRLERESKRFLEKNIKYFSEIHIYDDQPEYKIKKDNHKHPNRWGALHNLV